MEFQYRIVVTFGLIALICAYRFSVTDSIAQLGPLCVGPAEPHFVYHFSAVYIWYFARRATSDALYTRSLSAPCCNRGGGCRQLHMRYERRESESESESERETQVASHHRSRDDIPRPVRFRVHRDYSRCDFAARERTLQRCSSVWEGEQHQHRRRQ